MSYSRGNRVFYDSATGRYLWETGEVWESPVPAQHEEILGDIKFVDLELKSYNPMEKYIIGIDLATKQPIFRNYYEPEVDPEPTEEQPTEEV